jgi:predicted phosphodiesterase
MKLNILSDLHLGQGELAPPANDAEVIVLAGDIGRPAQALAWAAQLGKPVLYVAGNHEFYGGSLQGTAAQLEELAAGSAIRVLDQGSQLIGNVRFLGCTLWTDFRLFGEGERQPHWLARELAKPHDGPTVVITHHAPSRASIHPRFEGSLVNACFVSDAQYLLDGARAQLWIHGHTHDSFDYVQNGTRVVCNPRGYARGGVNENLAFDPDFMVEVA